jgi:catechol 2,3-dioxygenase-like lactoylglutathione lyase family enzyme
MPEFTGIHHIALTVSDLSRSIPFYERLWGMAPIGNLDGPHLRRRMFALPGGTLLGLTEHDSAATAFSPYAAGLDHLSFAVADRAALDSWAAHLDAVGIAHGDPVEDATGVMLTLTDPDGTALEFFAAK